MIQNFQLKEEDGQNPPGGSGDEIGAAINSDDEKSAEIILNRFRWSSE